METLLSITVIAIPADQSGSLETYVDGSSWISLALAEELALADVHGGGFS